MDKLFYEYNKEIDKYDDLNETNLKLIVKNKFNVIRIRSTYKSCGEIWRNNTKMMWITFTTLVDCEAAYYGQSEINKAKLPNKQF